jgi:hypothetical protein
MIRQRPPVAVSQPTTRPVASGIAAADAAGRFDVSEWVAGRLGCDPKELVSREGGHQGRDHSEVRRYWLGAEVAATVTLSANRRNLGGQDRRLLVLISPQGSDYRGLEPDTDVLW